MRCTLGGKDSERAWVVKLASGRTDRRALRGDRRVRQGDISQQISRVVRDFRGAKRDGPLLTSGTPFREG
jgi:hypothetical protein